MRARVFVAAAWALAVAVTVSPLRGAEPPRASAEGARPQALLAHMRFLADDQLQGRGTGTPGYDMAALYVAAQFEALGLEPAGDAGSYYQQVPLRSAQVDPAGSRLAWIRDGRRETLAFGRDYVAAANFNGDGLELRAPVVFVGYGVSAPELGRDDYAALDVRGKVVAYLFGAPDSFPVDQRAHYGQALQKMSSAAAHGAVGTLLVRTPRSERLFPWKRLVQSVGQPAMRWLEADGRPADVPRELRGGAVLSVEASERLLQAAGRTLDDVATQAKSSAFRGFDLGVEVQLETRTRHTDLRSPNVAGLLRGSDASLAAQTVVFSAHLDHVGVGEPRDGDAIYNGAYDNASGVAGLLEVARLFSSAPRPRRSVLFLAVTGEERGLLGSDYFARHPTVGPLVADVNLDMIIMLGSFRDVIAFGAEHSSLGDDVARAARAVGLELRADPWPEQSLFVRSDHYSFVRQGVPSIYPTPGIGGTEGGRDLGAEFESWIDHVYHSPQDDLSQHIDAAAGARLVDAAYLTGRAVADADQVPTWKQGDFFGETYGRRAPVNATR